MFKKYNKKNLNKRVLKEIWRINNFPFIHELFHWPSIDFLSKFKNGDKIFYEWQKCRFLIKGKMPLPWLEIFITTRCTMNCKHCNTYLPEFKNHSKPMTFEQFKSDLDKVLSAVDYINILVLVGGEPLLVNDLDKMISYALSKSQIHRIILPTNCTILPNEKLLKAMKNKRLTVQISDYTHVQNLPDGITVKYDEFKKLLNDNKILYSNYQEKKNKNTWFTVPELYPDRKDENTVEKHFDECFAKYCSGIIEGALVPCMASMFMYKNLDLSQEIKDEIVNLREIDSSKVLTDKLIEYYSRPYTQFCHYCHHENIKSGLPCGEQA